MPASFISQAYGLMKRRVRALAVQMDHQPDWVWVAIGLLMAVCPVAAASWMILLAAGAL